MHVFDTLARAPDKLAVAPSAVARRTTRRPEARAINHARARAPLCVRAGGPRHQLNKMARARPSGRLAAWPPAPCRLVSVGARQIGARNRFGPAPTRRPIWRSCFQSGDAIAPPPPPPRRPRPAPSPRLASYKVRARLGAYAICISDLFPCLFFAWARPSARPSGGAQVNARVPVSSMVPL